MKLSRKRLLLLHAAVIGIIVIYFLLPFGCPVKYFFHFPCPTCGMTRSALALLQGDFSASFKLNPMTVPFGLLLLFAVHKDLFPLKKRTKDIIVVSGAICVFSVYIIRIIFMQK